MYILPINFSYKQNSLKPTFMGVTNVVTKSGSLDSKTTQLMGYFMRAFREIEEKLAQMTIEGRNALLDKFPNLKITDTMTFSNCGDEKYSIIVNRASDYHTNNGLVKIVTIKNPETKSEQRESFVTERESKLLKDPDPNNQRNFPQERIYMSQGEITERQINEKLNKICDDLDQPLLEIRKYLTINMNKYIKTPDGVIPYDINQKFGNIRKTLADLSDLYKEIPHKRAWKLKSQFPNLSLISGQQYPVFKNLGNDNLIISFAPVESAKFDGLSRLQVYDRNKNLMRVFTIKDNKFIKNVKEGEHLYLPDFLTYVDEKEINEEKYLPEFKKYIELYERELNNYKSYVTNYIKEYNKVRIPGEFAAETTQKLSRIHSKYKEVKSAIKQLPQEIASLAKNEYIRYKQPPNGQGIIFKDIENNKEIFYLPAKSKMHSNLAKISITDTKTNLTESYLIHEDKYVVKNYNPSYTTLPRILTYMTNDELEDVDIEKYLDFLEESLENFDKKVDAYHKVPQTKEQYTNVTASHAKVTKVKTNKNTGAQKALIKECTSMLKNTLANELNYGLINLDVTLSNIKKKVQEYMRTQNG